MITALRFWASEICGGATLDLQLGPGPDRLRASTCLSARR